MFNDSTKFYYSRAALDIYQYDAASPQILIASVVSGAKIKVSGLVTTTNEEYDGKIGYGIDAQFRYWNFTGGNIRLNSEYIEENAHLNIYIRLDASLSGSSGIVMLSPVEYDIDGYYKTNEGGMEVIVHKPGNYFYINIGEATLNSENRWELTLFPCRLGTDEAIEQGGTGVLDQMFRIGGTPPDQYITVLMPLFDVVIKSTLTLGDTQLSSILKSNDPQFEDKWESNIMAATTAAIASKIRKEIAELDNRFLRKDVNDHTEHTLGVGNLNVGYDEQGNEIQGVNGDLKVKGSTNTNGITNIGDINNDGDINNTNGTITTKNLEVTGSAHFFELVIDKIKATGGSRIDSVADGFKLDYIQTTGNYTYLCWLSENDGKRISNMWQAGDFAITMTMNAATGTSYDVSNKYWWGKVDEVSTATTVIVHEGREYHWIKINHTNFPTTGTSDYYDGNFNPEIGDDIAQLGSITAGRGGALYFAAYSSIDKGNPAQGIPALVAPLFCQYVGINKVGMNNLHAFRYSYFAANGNKIVGNLSIETANEPIEVKQELIEQRVYAYKITATFDAPLPTAEGWVSSTIPTQALPYMWRRTHRFFSDGTNDYIVEFQTQWNGGEKGADGFTYYKALEAWAVSTSSSTQQMPPETDWHTTPPTQSPTNGQYLWYRYKTYRKQGSVEDTAYNNAAQYVIEIIGYSGTNGNAITSVDNDYQVNASNTQHGDNWNTYAQAIASWSKTNKYLWQRESIRFSDGTTTYQYHVVAEYTEDGNGISSITEYYAINNSTTPPADSEFSTTVKQPTAAKRYLWNYEVITYTKAQSTTTPKRILAVYGEKGEPGDDGKGIISITNYYAVSSSNTEAPTQWSTDVPTMTKTLKYLWNYELITYTDSSTSQTTPRVLGSLGDDGKGISSITEYYLASSQNSGVTPSTQGWTTTVQTMTATLRYLWNYEKIVFSDTTIKTTSPCIIGVYGDKGDKGDDGYTYKIDESTIQYANGTSSTTAPTTGWSASTAAEKGKYRWRRYKTAKYQGEERVALSDFSYECIGYTAIDGTSSYTWVKYADTATYSGGKYTPTSMYDTPKSTTNYIGIAYNKTTPTESETISDYEWSKWRGDKGDAGDNVSRLVCNTPYITSKTIVSKQKTSTPVNFELVTKSEYAITGFVGKTQTAITTPISVSYNGTTVPNKSSIPTASEMATWYLVDGVIYVKVYYCPYEQSTLYTSAPALYLPKAQSNIIITAKVGNDTATLAVPVTIDFSATFGGMEITDEGFNSHFTQVDSHLGDVDAELSTHTSMIAQNAQEIELRATKTELSTAETKLTQTANYINISAQQYANNTRNMIANGMVNWVGNYSAGSVSFASVRLQANRVYVLSAKGFVNSSTNGGAVTVQLDTSNTIQFTPYDSAMQTKHLLVKPTSAATYTPKIVPTTSWTAAGEYGYISYVQLVDVTNEYNSKPSTMTDAEFVYQSVTGYSLNVLDKTTNPNLIDGNAWVSGYAPSKAANVADQRGKKGSVLQLGTNNLLYLGNFMNKGKTYAISFYAQVITASPVVKIAVQKGIYTVIGTSYTRAMGQSYNGHSFGSGTSPVSVAVESGWAKYTFVVTPTDSNISSYLLINVDGGAAYLNDLRVEEWGRATEYSSVNITADQVYIQSGSKDLGNVFSVDGNTGDVVMRDLTARNVTVEGVINNMVSTIDCDTDDRVHYNSVTEKWELDLLRCPSVFKLINLPEAGVSSQQGIFIPWHISGQSAATTTAQYRSQTKYGTGVWHDMTTMEFYQLLGRDFTIIVGDSTKVTQLNYGCSMTTLIDGSSSVLNALQGLCYFRSFTDNNAYILTPSTVVHIKLFQACYFPTGGTPFAAFIWQVNALAYNDVAGLVDDFWD